ncbi:MAG: aminoacyl-tRNA hydrolase [Candidatus Marinamargulisbacteria bacterium]
MAIQLIVGLGNPGQAYADTPHNIGFQFINALIRLSPTDVTKKNTLKSHVYSLDLNGHLRRVIKPQTYMNLSGEAVKCVMNFYKIPPSDICIVTDDLDVDFGRVRIRPKGGAGTHNGMKSIIQQLGTNEFMRLRLGIGPKPSYLDAHQVVLQPFKPTKKAALPTMLDTIAQAFVAAIDAPIDRMMNQLNATPYLPDPSPPTHE